MRLVTAPAWDRTRVTSRDLLAEASALSARLQATLAEAAARDAGPSRATAADALHRLVRGAASASDVELLPRSVEGGRLLSALLGQPGSAERVGRGLSVSGSVVVVALSDQHLVALVPHFAHRDGQQRARQRVELFAAQVGRLDPAARVGSSAVLTSAADLPLALADSVDAARLAQRAPSPVGWAEDLWAEITSVRLRAAVGTCAPQDNPLQRLRCHDSKAGSALLETVRAWLRHNGDTAMAAAELHVHPNSLRYRLRRAREISGLDLDDPVTRSVTYLLLVDPERERSAL